MNPRELEQILKESEPLWDGKFPAITTSGFGDEPLRPATATYAEKLWNVGWTDGAAGQPPEHGERLIQAHDDDRSHRIVTELNHLKTRADSRAAASKERLERMTSDLSGTRAELSELEGLRRRDQTEFSLITGVLYIFVALILLLSDMPLSLSLVAEGFHLRLSKEIDGRKIVVDDIFSPDWQNVLRYLWQPIILAVGIACLGIFFKIVTDYLLSSAEDAPRDSRFAKAFKWMRRVFFALALLLMLGGLWSIGTLRARQQALAAAEESGSTAAASQVESADLWTNRSFITLAITLPLIGGICFSVGSKRVQRFVQLWMARLRAAWQGWRADREREGRIVQESESAFLGQELQRLATREGDVDLTALSVYLHGYTRGLTMPQKLEPHRSLYSHCKDVLQQWIAAGVQEGTIERIQRFGKGRR